MILNFFSSNPSTVEIGWFQDFYTWLQSNSVELVGHGLTFFGIVASAWIVIWKLGKQHQAAIQLQQHSEREKLRLRLYEKLSEQIRKFNLASARVGNRATMIPINLESFQNQKALGLTPPPIRERAEQILELHSSLADAVIGLIRELETWAVAIEGHQLFRAALNAAQHDAQETFQKFYAEAIKFLPFDALHGSPSTEPGPVVPPQPSGTQLKQLVELAKDYNEALWDQSGYVYDLSVEVQNNLLAGLFENRVERRRPIDPRIKVLSSDPNTAERLINYFENETAWGRSKQSSEEAVRQAYESPKAQ